MKPSEAVRHLLDLHVAEQEGLRPPKPDDWIKAVDLVANALPSIISAEQFVEKLAREDWRGNKPGHIHEAERLLVEAARLSAPAPIIVPEAALAIYGPAIELLRKIAAAGPDNDGWISEGPMNDLAAQVLKDLDERLGR